MPIDPRRARCFPDGGALRAKAPMRVIALIHDPGIVRRTLEHLGRRAPEASERGPPG